MKVEIIEVIYPLGVADGPANLASFKEVVVHIRVLHLDGEHVGEESLIETDGVGLLVLQGGDKSAQH